MTNEIDREDALKGLAIRLAAIADDTGERSMRALEQAQRGATQMDEASRRLKGSADRFASDALTIIGTRSEQAVTQGISRALAEFERRTTQSADRMTWASDAMAEQRRLLTRAQTSLVWKGLAALMLGSLLALGGSIYVARDQMQKIEQSGFALDIARAMQSRAITRCGDALCVKAGKGQRRHPANTDYVLIEP
ncbi:MAG: hypothetical protein J7605_09145 [Variovorax sp.]|nr:hypothetical protein [Variovorax sp.]